MADLSSLPVPTTLPLRSPPSAFELLIACNPPILESLFAQIPTETILHLYHTSYFLQQFLQSSPTSWRYISWRLSQPAATTANVTNNGTGIGPRQSSNYALDQLLIYVINPFSTILTSLELDNTAVSGGTLTQTVLILRRDTLRHVSVRGCKNVSLKYHINPWLQMHALAKERTGNTTPFGYETLALKSLYTYRCRHHRRRPYLPSSLARKESDSEPTHELVKTCHRLGIWTDTAWCTTPGARCYRRRGYVTMRVPQDPREVWVVYDRLWRSRNWLGPAEQRRPDLSDKNSRKRKRDCRSWEYDEEAVNGEAIGTQGEGKAVPAHLRYSHRKFVEEIYCHNCSAKILERCEQCSVMMHCSGCRKTLCASCAFDRPYLRNLNASDEEKNNFWWAPGCAISPCSMQDQDNPPAPGGAVQPGNGNALPNIKFRWCCTEPVFSGGGGITFGNGSNRDTDRIRAAPLPLDDGWDDPEFTTDNTESSQPSLSRRVPHEHTQNSRCFGPGGRWPSIDNLLQPGSSPFEDGQPPASVPRILCDECYNSEEWKIKCTTCAIPLCLKHDVRDRLKVRICGFKDLIQEKQEHRSRQKALQLLGSLIQQRREKILSENNMLRTDMPDGKAYSIPFRGRVLSPSPLQNMTLAEPSDPEARVDISSIAEAAAVDSEVNALLQNLRSATSENDAPRRPLSRGSSSSGPRSRSSSPAHSTKSVSTTPEPGSISQSLIEPVPLTPKWLGCQSFFCPALRPPGDHRRRCVAVMRQCSECKVHVCGTCVATLDPACPCKGCRATPPDEEGFSQMNTETALFFCPNCRWERMQTGKCRRRSEAFLSLQAARRKSKKREKAKKPLEERRPADSIAGTSANIPSQDQAIDGLVEFFTHLNAELGPTSAHDLGVDLEYDSHGDIQELEDMGALARDLIRRIQRLRENFPPGSLAAMALPDIRLEETEGGEDNQEAFEDGQDNDVESSSATEAGMDADGAGDDAALN